MSAFSANEHWGGVPGIPADKLAAPLRRAQMDVFKMMQQGVIAGVENAAMPVIVFGEMAIACKRRKLLAGYGEEL